MKQIKLVILTKSRKDKYTKIRNNWGVKTENNNKMTEQKYKNIEKKQQINAKKNKR